MFFTSRTWILFCGLLIFHLSFHFFCRICRLESKIERLRVRGVHRSQIWTLTQLFFFSFPSFPLWNPTPVRCQISSHRLIIAGSFSIYSRAGRSETVSSPPTRAREEKKKHELMLQICRIFKKRKNNSSEAAAEKFASLTGWHRRYTSSSSSSSWPPTWCDRAVSLPWRKLKSQICN